MTLGSERIGLRRACQVRRACDAHVEVFVKCITSLVLHKLRLHFVNVGLKVLKFLDVSVLITEVAVTRKVIDKRLDHIGF